MERKTKRWLAIYTKPRWEKKVDRGLEEVGLERYCPLNRVRKKWSDRVKMVEEPLFKSYVFVHVAESDHTPVRMTNGVLNYVYWNGKPAIIKEREIDTIKKFLNDYENVQAIAAPLAPRQKVRIETGLLMNTEGIVNKILHNKVEVLIESLGYVLVATLDKKNVQPV